MDNNLIINDPRPNRADALHNRALLLETAQRLFAEQGVEAVSMTAIAQAAGVGKGTLYRHFENKVELCEALLDHDQRELQNRTLTRLRAVEDPLSNLRWFLSEVTAFVERNQSLLCASNPEIQALQHPAHWWWRQTIHKLLERQQVQGDLSYMADVLYIMLDPRTYRFQRHALGYSIERILDGLYVTLARLVS